jgi:CRP-like cAMP-binding protein
VKLQLFYALAFTWLQLRRSVAAHPIFEGVSRLRVIIPDIAMFQKRLGALPLATYKAGETVLVAGSKTGRLLILKRGAVTIVKEAIEIAKVAEPGAVFGELSALLDQPHTADVQTAGIEFNLMPLQVAQL